MKPKIFAICSVFLMAFQLISGQTNRITSGSELNTFMHSDLDYIKNQMDRYSKIEGSAYLDNEFHVGALSVNQKKYTNIKLRYNNYEGYFEFQTPEGIKYFDPRIIPADTVWMDGDTYLYVSYYFGKTLDKAYMKLEGGDITKVFCYEQVILTQPVPAKGYEDARPASFDPLAKKIYIQLHEEACVEFKGKKSLEEVFPEYHTQLARYVKSEKLKLKNVEDVILLCRYFDS